MNPVRSQPKPRTQSYGVNVLNFPEGKRPKATGVSPWYGVYWIVFNESFMLSKTILEGLRKQRLELRTDYMPMKKIIVTVAALVVIFFPLEMFVLLWVYLGPASFWQQFALIGADRKSVV